MVAIVIPLYLTFFLFVTVITYIYMKNKDGFRYIARNEHLLKNPAAPQRPHVFPEKVHPLKRGPFWARQ